MQRPKQNGMQMMGIALQASRELPIASQTDNKIPSGQMNRRLYRVSKVTRIRIETCLMKRSSKMIPKLLVTLLGRL